MVHPSEDILCTKGSELKNKIIVLGITGSVAAIKSPEIARELMRYGARVFPVMTMMAKKIIQPELMEWATGNSVVCELTGKLEHIVLANKADLILIAPATANTISKIACGIDDTTVTSVVSAAIGLIKPIIIAPAMHKSMFNHPIIKEHIRKLQSIGCEFIDPEFTEDKAKIATVENIVKSIIKKLSTG